MEDIETIIPRMDLYKAQELHWIFNMDKLRGNYVSYQTT